MKTFKNYFKKGSSILLFISISSTVLLIQSCKTDSKEDKTKVQTKKENVVEIITKHMDFQMPDTIPSGWNIFNFKNQSPQTHFFQIEKYPDGKTMEDVKKLVIPYFDSGMKLINEGKSKEGFAEFGKLPKWFGEVIVLGGVGLVSPGNTGETMIKLNPGHYFIECYVKASNGIFHSSMGMMREFDVSNIDSGNKELKADYNIDISSQDGITFKDSIKSGSHVFSVFFKDQKVYGNFAGHDVNLAKIDTTVNIKSLDQWMNWVDPKGLIEPAPKGVNFLGGVNNMPAGSKGYFVANLKPGKYVLISEVPNALSKKMLKIFIVSE